MAAAIGADHPAGREVEAREGEVGPEHRSAHRMAHRMLKAALGTTARPPSTSFNPFDPPSTLFDLLRPSFDPIELEESGAHALMSCACDGLGLHEPSVNEPSVNEPSMSPWLLGISLPPILDFPKARSKS